MHSYKQISILAIATLTLLISACSSKPPQSDSGNSISSANYVQSDFERLLAQARASTSPSIRAQLYFDAGRASLANGLHAQAQYTFDAVQPELLSPDLFQHFTIAQIELGIQLGDKLRLEQHVSKLDLQQALRTSLSEQEKIVRLMASCYSILGEPLKSAVLLSDYSGVFGVQESAHLNEEIWVMLQRSSTEELTQYVYSGNYPNTKAWLDLARQLKLRQASIDQQYASLISWLNVHPDHPATTALPLELELLSMLPDTSPKEIILALPLSGKFKDAGNAVRDGFLANYYMQAGLENQFTIKTFDTAANSIQDLYSSISNSQALDHNTLVIGPLIKNSLEELASLGEIPLPTLALNDLGDDIGHPNLYLFGLNPEDELRQVAREMIDNNLTRIAVIAPNSSRGHRLAEEFKSFATQLGGHVVTKKHYENQSALATTVSDLLSTSRSNQRSRQVQITTGIRVESEPRRRRDLDAVFMLADNQTSKQIKPLLAFNFASDLPVFASSQIHDPLSHESNSDLNGVKFVDIPWMFARTAPLRSQIEELLRTNTHQYARFFALGADAYTLAPRLQLLIDIDNTHVQGQTGLLSVSPQGRVTRELQWATYRKGRAQTIN